jgi:hypothetical protein
MRRRSRSTAGVSVVLLLALSLLGAGGAGAVVIDSHTVVITHIGNSICSVRYAHSIDNAGTSWTDVLDWNGNCTYVRTRAYWFHEDIGWYTALGPVHGTYSALSSSGILSWGHHPVCGMTTVWHCVNRQ